MAFFKNSNVTFDLKNSDTLIGQEAYFQGTITVKGSLRVDGRVDGSIVDAKMVTIGKSGKVKGDISCETCSVSGDIKGSIVALEHIDLLSGAKVEGDLRAPGMFIEDGALFNGNCSMSKTNGGRAGKTEIPEKAVAK